jgi:hypothetical protein
VLDLVERSLADRAPVGVVDEDDGIAERGRRLQLGRDLVADERDGVAPEVGAHRCEPEEAAAAVRHRRRPADRARLPQHHAGLTRHLCGRNRRRAAVAADDDPHATVAQRTHRRRNRFGPRRVGRVEPHRTSAHATVRVGPLDREAHAALLVDATDPLWTRGRVDRPDHERVTLAAATGARGRDDEQGQDERGQSTQIRSPPGGWRRRG